MADLMSGGGRQPSSSRHELAPPHLMAPPPVSTTPPSGIKSPTIIMQERAAREARQQAAREQAEAEKRRQEREAAALHRQRAEEEMRNEAARRAAGVAREEAQRGNSHHAIETPQPPQTPQAQHQNTNDKRWEHNRQTSMPSGSNHQEPSQSRTRPPRTPQTQAPKTSQQITTPKPETPSPNAPTPSASKPRNSFPHAFERWETLSAHWEGLTSYWIRRLEQNKDEVNRDPMGQQLARQVTDLSAAGANLFHAVVELQRLRASSERKFQRWFFETRADLERAQEEKSRLEEALKQEQRNRDEAIREALEKDQGSSLAQKQLAEMRKELAISKDEARRAWEELGRREQAERDRTLSLQSGQPTIVGGVQVVPMTQSNRQTQTYQQSYVPEPVASPPPAGGNAGYYQHQQPNQQQPAQQFAGTPVRGYSGGEYVVDVQGNPILDAHGNKIPFAAPPSTHSGSDAEAEEYDTPATTNPPSGTYDPPPSSSAPGAQPWSGVYSTSQDYSGSGYGDVWVPDQRPTHHHPTRLSDVIEEEDERSRTSVSQVSRA